MPQHAVSSASSGDVAGAVATLTLGFAADPVNRWVFGDPAVFFAVYPRFIQAFGGKAFDHGSADVTENCSGAALWLPPGVEPDYEVLYEIGTEYAAARAREGMDEVFEAMDAMHPKEPCWYLPLIAVDPIMQNNGVGTALMRKGVARCDADGLPAYLESSNPRNISLYRRFGFEPLQPIRVSGWPEIVPMLRPAR